MSSPLNAVQMEANRRNAQQSTGPRTEIGRKTSSLNALRHGLTARVVVLPSEDLAAYKTFSDEYLASLAPDTFPERQCAQTIIDTQWRLNRVRSIEEGMLALGHQSPEGQIDYGHPEIHAALTAAAVWRDHSQAFVNLSMHEQRLYRILTAATKTLDEMTAKRIAARQAELDAAVALSNLNKMLGRAVRACYRRVRFQARRNRHRKPPPSQSSGSQSRPGMQLRPQKVPPTPRRAMTEKFRLVFLKFFFAS
jgi:hypothetical protein